MPLWLSEYITTVGLIVWAPSDSEKISPMVTKETLPAFVSAFVDLAMPEDDQIWADQLERLIRLLIAYYGPACVPQPFAQINDAGTMRRLRVGTIEVRHDEDTDVTEVLQTDVRADTQWVRADRVGQWAAELEVILIDLVPSIMPESEIKRRLLPATTNQAL